ncbi:uncharacterized protein LOC132743025 [Ruditapes philippinarum]|uniref:uncharacterized protein LOC132743025 n=1 Tax=Ruditapes philippinarum TaxID=129788 RepID=UPI00295C057D|nr:uncharacterized protein LOC132743025 [Ruditapes philippinarum]
MCAVYSFTLNDIRESHGTMTGKRGFCFAQLFGVFLFCIGLVGGILIGIYAYSWGPDRQVLCKNFPECLIEGYKSTESVTTKLATTSPKSITEMPDDDDCTVCKTKSFTYTINNQLREPYFNNTITIEIEEEGLPLMKYMERAADEDNSSFNRFQVSYYSGMGYFISSIINVTANYAVDQTFWRITTSEGPSPKSIDSYMPMDGVMILLNFTSSSR